MKLGGRMACQAQALAKNGAVLGLGQLHPLESVPANPDSPLHHSAPKTQ